MEEELTVGDIMRKEVVVLPTTSSIQEAAKLMAANKVGSVVVIDRNEAKGIVTERDIVRKVVAEGRDPQGELSEILSSPLIVITPETSIKEAAEAMRNNNVRRLPIIDDNKYLVGMITDRDIIRVLPGFIDVIEEGSFATV